MDKLLSCTQWDALGDGHEFARGVTVVPGMYLQLQKRLGLISMMCRFLPKVLSAVHRLILQNQLCLSRAEVVQNHLESLSFDVKQRRLPIMERQRVPCGILWAHLPRMANNNSSMVPQEGLNAVITSRRKRME